MTKDSAQSAMLWIIATGFFMQTLDTTILNTALPAIARSFNEKPLSMQLVVVAYTLTMATLTPTSGWLADRFGTRRVYFVAVLLFIFGSLCCASSTSRDWLILSRVVQGVGGAMLLPVGRLAVLKSAREQYISALAFVSIAAQIGPIFGPVLGGWFVQTLSWHWIFLINVPIGLAGLLLINIYMPQDASDELAPFDFLGCALLSLAMVAISLALDLPIAHHRTEWSLALACVSVLSVLAYIPHARHRQHPLFRLGLFGDARFRIGLIGNFVCRIGCNAVPYLLPLLMQLELGFSPLHSGMMLLPAAIAGTLAKRWIAPLVERFGYDTFLLVNTIVVGAAIVSFAALSAHQPLWIEIAQLAIFGAANSMQFAVMNSVTLSGLPRRDAGSGNSLFSMVQMLAIGLGVTICGQLVNIFTAHGHSMMLGFRLTFACVGVSTLLSALIFRRLRGVS
ncbi:MAG: DHA2 family efflux MFS transporter permease subunit [Janthinobacterium lividum]